MYKVIGMPESEITSYYAPRFKLTVDSIDWWFSETPNVLNKPSILMIYAQ